MFGFMKTALFGSLLLASGASSAEAADVAINESKSVIAIIGLINPGDFDKWWALAEPNKATLKAVVLAGPGGILAIGGAPADGWRIASDVHDRRLDTVIPPKTGCFSVCALIALMGKERVMFSTSTLGVHSAGIAKPVTRNGKKEMEWVRDDAGANSMVTYLFGKAEVPMSILNLWIMTPGNTISNIRPMCLRGDPKCFELEKLGLQYTVVPDSDNS